MPPDFERSDGAVQVQEISVLAAGGLRPWRTFPRGGDESQCEDQEVKVTFVAEVAVGSV